MTRGGQGGRQGGDDMSGSSRFFMGRIWPISCPFGNRLALGHIGHNQMLGALPCPLRRVIEPGHRLDKALSRARGHKITYFPLHTRDKGCIWAFFGLPSLSTSRSRFRRSDWGHRFLALACPLSERLQADPPAAALAPGGRARHGPQASQERPGATQSPGWTNYPSGALRASQGLSGEAHSSGSMYADSSPRRAMS